MRVRYVARKSTVEKPPPEQEWVVWLIDEFGDEWTHAFHPTRRRARRHAFQLNYVSIRRWRRARWRRNKETRT